MRNISVNRKLCFSIFIVFTTLFIGCNNTNKVNEKTKNEINIANIASFTYPGGLQINPNIPFELLVDKEYKKQFPDTFNYEVFKPNVLLLPINLNEKDPVSLQSFPSIMINLENSENDFSIYLGDSIKNFLFESINRSIANTTYKINDWKKIDTFLTKDSIDGFVISYSQINVENKEVNIDNTYLFSRGKVIRITLTSPDSTYNEWKKYYDEIVSSAAFPK